MKPTSEYDSTVVRAYRVRVALFLVACCALIVLLSVVFRCVNTLSRLQVVEAERDQWQRPAEVLQSLGLRPGSRVVDLGCGAGYFSLKLARSVGNEGQVTALDIRGLSLAFLGVRARLEGLYNVYLIHGDAEVLEISAGSVDALLVANTYHEFRHRKAVLDGALRMLVPGGRLAVLDRAPAGDAIHDNSFDKDEQQVPAPVVERDVLQAGFENVKRIDEFTLQADQQIWWLHTAQKPLGHSLN